MHSGIHVSLTAEKLFYLFGNFWVTNSLLTSWIVIFFLVILSLLVTRNISIVPGYFQSIAEIVVEGIWNLFSTILNERINTFFPLVATYFIYIISLNWVGLLPGVGTIMIEKIEEGHKLFIPLFRSGTADLNTTLGLALIAVIVVQFTGFKTLGVTYLKKFINFSNPILFFVGILELISEFTKVISFAFRLFGNIFAGEVLLTVIAFLMPLLVPVPFLGLELFVGFIQALIFSMLTSVFIALATTKSEH
ncbi:F0F1 ATP synthase subunit A [Candidatus Gottesmanbacteria bacterium]|nr:F0F1 ATP synthase subunit A [Candidatus Gottesmanbacteria bacterium]